MIKTISMSDVASYKASTSLDTDKKTTLIYGLNGTGKSTLSNYLYSPSNTEYSKCSHTPLADVEVLVYNNSFVKDHFHEVDKLNGIFTISKENSTAEKELAQVEGELRSATAKRDDLRVALGKEAALITTAQAEAEGETWEIKTKYSGGDRVLDFCLEGLMGKKSRLFEYIFARNKTNTKPTKTIQELKSETEAISGKDAQTFPTLPLLTFNEAIIEEDSIFNRSIVGNKNSSIAGLIEKLKNADWVKNGLPYLETLGESSDESCPFCQAKTISENLSHEIKSYFDETYNQSLAKLESLRIQYQASIAFLGNTSQHLENIFTAEKSEELKAKENLLVSLLHRNLERIENKIKAPSEAQNLEVSKTALADVNDIISEVNKRIVGHNKKINNRNQELARIKSEFWDLMRWEHDSALSKYEKIKIQANQKSTVHQTNLAKADLDVANLTAKASEIQKKTVNIESAIANINSNLSNLGIDSFSISKHRDNLYKIAREGDKQGDFHTLSEGEKTVISFLYFVELSKGRKRSTDISKKKIAVIDDPISSLSHIFIFNIGQLIKKEFIDSDQFIQVFVLTHSLYFFYELTDINHTRRKDNQKLIRIIKNKAGSKFTEMKYEEIQNDYQAYWSVVKDNNQPAALIANCMRNIIEYFFGFVEKRDFNNVFQRPVLTANKYQSFNRFMNRESHSFGQNIFDYKEFDFEKFHEAFKLVFEESGFSDHHAMMMK